MLGVFARDRREKSLQSVSREVSGTSKENQGWLRGKPRELHGAGDQPFRHANDSRLYRTRYEGRASNDRRQAGRHGWVFYRAYRDCGR